MAIQTSDDAVRLLYENALIIDEVREMIPILKRVSVARRAA
jgi:hypothetical protein